jgi:hypothetical protein
MSGLMTPESLSREGSPAPPSIGNPAALLHGGVVTAAPAAAQEITLSADEPAQIEVKTSPIVMNSQRKLNTFFMIPMILNDCL